MSGAEETAAVLKICSAGSCTRGLTWEELLKQGVVDLTNGGRVTQLSLSNNDLTALSPAIGKLTSLSELYLSDNELTALPPAIGKLTSLLYLNLKGNQLTALPSAIGKLTSLTGLALNDNHLTALPTAIGELASLTTLYLNSNELTALPPAIGKLTSLISLDLYDNQLTDIPPAIGELTSLISLHISDNPITSGLENLRHLTKLSTLYLVPPDLLASSLNLPAALRDESLQDQFSFLREKYARASRRYCVLACLSSLTAKLYAGEERAAGAVKKARRAPGRGGGRVGRGSLQGVLAFDSITSADVWRYILEFV